MKDQSDRKVAKKIIKLAKKNPEYYTPGEISYAKMIKRINKKKK
jgi:hypothetical protein